MSEADTLKLEKILSSMAEEGHLEKDWRTLYLAEIQRQTEKISWQTHMVTLVGMLLAAPFLAFGVWLISEMGTAVGWFVGVILIGGAVVISRKSYATKYEPLVVLLILAGQAILIFNSTRIHEGTSGWQIFVSLMLFCINFLLIFLCKSKLQLVFSPVTMTGAALILFNSLNMAFVIPFIAPTLFVWAAIRIRNEDEVIGEENYPYSLPITYGVLLSCIGVVFLSVISVFGNTRPMNILPAYPHPWISTALLTITLVVILINSASIFSRRSLAAPYCIFTFVVGLASWAAPGIMLALGVICLGIISLNKLIRALGWLVLAVYLILYIYPLELTPLLKSSLLILTGLSLLGGRKLLLCEK